MLDAIERRSKRSDEPALALQYLVEALVDRSDASAALVIDARGTIVAGVGAPAVLRNLADLGGDPARAPSDPRFAKVTEGTDWFACEVKGAKGRMWIVALGQRMRKMHHAMIAAARILGGVDLAYG